MPITTTLTDVAKAAALDAIAPAQGLRLALLNPKTKGAYGRAYGVPYVVGMDGDEVATLNGYTQGGQPLVGKHRNLVSVGWSVSYDDVTWDALGTLVAGGAVVYDEGNGNRILSFVAFPKSVSATDAPFTVKCSAPRGGSGFLVFA